MPSPAWLTLSGDEDLAEGATSEESIGGRAVEAHEDEIQVLGTEQVIYVPTDQHSSHQTGAAISNGLTVTKLFDKSSPLLLQAMTKGQVFETAELKYFRISPTGEEEHYFTQEMEGVVITDIESYMPNCLDPYNANITHMEKVTLQYTHSIWTHEVSGTEGHFEVGIFPAE
jgi:type VI secretion system secreted protein Hcp